MKSNPKVKPTTSKKRTSAGGGSCCAASSRDPRTTHGTGTDRRSRRVPARRGPDRRGLTVVGLPGHFSARGDWFLAVAQGSRSARLGERAIDILSSRCGNISRLQAGIGLPVRTTIGPKSTPTHEQQRLEYRTNLPYAGDDRQEQPIPYYELRKLGACDTSDRYGRVGNFFWFWRSTIQSYDLHARIWQKWWCAALKPWRSWPRAVRPLTKCLEEGHELWRSAGREVKISCSHSRTPAPIHKSRQPSTPFHSRRGSIRRAVCCGHPVVVLMSNSHL